MKRREVKYSVLARAIREQIAAGTYKMGDRLPSENELSEEFNFSRQTVRQALGILEREGYLVRRRGSGTYVAKESPGLKKPDHRGHYYLYHRLYLSRHHPGYRRSAFL